MKLYFGSGVFSRKIHVIILISVLMFGLFSFEDPYSVAWFLVVLILLSGLMSLKRNQDFFDITFYVSVLWVLYYPLRLLALISLDGVETSVNLDRNVLFSAE